MSFDRLLRCGQRAAELADVFGHVSSQRYSQLDADHAENVKNLELKWVFQARSLEKFEATPLVVDGVMYTVQPPNDVVALDAATGTHRSGCTRYKPSPRGAPVLRPRQSRPRDPRRHAVHGHHRWPSRRHRREERPADLGRRASRRPEAGYALTPAPLVVKDKVIVGPAGGEYGIRGFIAAFDAKTGKEVWRFNTIPGPGEPGHETWGGDSWKTGGGSIWVTGSYDPDLEPDVLGHRQSGPRLERRHAPRRQPLHALGRRARRRHRQAEVALPVLAARRVRLRRVADSGAGRYPWQGRPRKADAVGQPQRLLLRARSHDGRSSCRASRSSSVNWADGLRRERPAQSRARPGADARGHARSIPGNQGGDQLVQPVVQPAHRPVLHPDRG